jgi:hypothetical protein
MIWHVEKGRSRGLRDICCRRIQDPAWDIGIPVVEEIAGIDAEGDVVAAVRAPAAQSSRPSRERPASAPSSATSPASAASSSTTSAGSARNSLLPA